MAHIEPLPPESHVLLVEGPNDKHVVWQICNRHPATPDFYIQDRGGIEPLLDAIGPELIVPGRRVLGIIADADDDLPARWSGIANRLTEEGIQMPAGPAADGVIIDTDSKPRVGIWLMPDNSLSGEIEGFIQQMIPPADPVWPLSQQYISGIPEQYRKFTRGKTLRAQIYAWLATREDPRQMGLAIRTHDLEVHGALCQRFVAWLAQLFR